MIIMTTYVSAFKVSNSKPFPNRGFVPGMFINRSKLLIIHIQHLAGPTLAGINSKSLQ